MNRALSKDLEFARKIQSNLIPARYPGKGSASFHSVYHPMIAVGGDLFDVISFEEDRQIGVFICDVSGHGVGAALIACMVKTLPLGSANRKMNPAEMCSYINGKLLGQTDDNFITAFYGIFDTETKMFRYTRCGHPYPLLLRRGETIELRGKGSVIGVLRNAAFHDNEVQLESGDRLFFFTDGVLESANADRVEFGDDKLKEILAQNSGTTLPATVDRVFAALNEFHGSDVFEDDVAVLGMEIE